MSDRIQVDGEALSALMDSELSEFELRRLLARISDEPELLATWERYNLVRAIHQPEPLNLQISAVSDTDSLSNRIMAAIEAEPAFGDASGLNDVTNKKKPGPLWTHQITKLAVAASVALAVFVGMQSVLEAPDAPFVGNSSVANSSVTDQTQAESAPFVNPVSDRSGSMQLAVDAEAQQRLNEYIRSVSIPSRPETAVAPYNVLLESPMLHPVSDLELIQEVERTNP